MRVITFFILGLVIFLSTSLSASIVNTKHNLSMHNSVVADVNETIIKAQTEQEVCVFCHIPHQSRPVGTPLWNRSMPITNYTMYDSDYLRRMDYPAVASDLGTNNNTPGALSRQCLSCHDGTVAVGAVFKLRREFMDASIIAMDGVDGSGNIPSTAAGFIGTNLTTHHPVGIEYDPTPELTFGNGEVRTMELVTDPEASSDIRLFSYSDYPGKKYVECSSCHDPHKEGPNTESNKFLHVDTGANLAQNFLATCTSCHTKKDWTGSVHQAPPNPDAQLYTDQTLIDNYGTARMDNLGCANCHVPHNAEGVPYLNRKPLGNTCFQGAASTVATATCHGVGGAKDIESVLTKAYAHPVIASSSGDSNHTNLDTLYGYGVGGVEDSDARGVGGMSWGTNKHAVCMDCHNPHRAQAGTHIADGTWYGASGKTQAEALAGNLVSNVLKGVNGIEPTSWPAIWTQPTEFTTMETATKEYQICFKCHSYWGLGPTTTGATSYVSPSGAIMTDLAWDMNRNNKSGHPVVVNAIDRNGSYAPKELLAAQLLTPWMENPGYNTMYCSDCHGNDTEIGGDPKGPHGSNLKYLLKGDNQYWPMKADGVTLYTMDDIVNGTDTGVICKNCHDIAYPHTNWWNKMANKGFACVECHVAVPHGSPVSRLIGYDTFPAPYNYNGNMLKMTGFRKNDGATVQNTDVWAPNNAACSGNSCHRNSDAANGAYDVDPYP